MAFSTPAPQHIAAIVGIFLAGAFGTGAAMAFTFDSIDGGKLDTDAWLGRPVLVVNTASLCGFTPQYDDLQALHDRYSAKGLVVLAVPSNDFNQELATGAEVKDFCDANFDLTLPMTEISHVKGPEAHPFYKWVKSTNGFVPGWNFNKILLGPDGQVLGTWGSPTKPGSQAIVGLIEPYLK